jgi:NTE family protein
MKSLVLSGGGSFGSFEAGVLYELLKAGMHFDTIYGTSTGALNSLLVAQAYVEKNPEILRSVWTETITKNNQIYNKNRIKFLLGKPPFDFAPLRRLISDKIDLDLVLKLNETIYVTATDLVSGNSVYFSNKDQNITVDRFLNAAIASASMPPVFDPVIIDDYQLVDGGLRENVPITKLLDNWHQQNYALIVLCDQKIMPKDKKWFDGIIEIGTKTVGIMMNEITSQNVKMAQTINNLLKQFGNESKELSNKKVINLEVIEPDKTLPGSVLSFDQSVLQTCFYEGQILALRYLENLS